MFYPESFIGALHSCLLKTVVVCAVASPRSSHAAPLLISSTESIDCLSCHKCTFYPTLFFTTSKDCLSCYKQVHLIPMQRPLHVIVIFSHILKALSVVLQVHVLPNTLTYCISFSSTENSDYLSVVNMCNIHQTLTLRLLQSDTVDSTINVHPQTRPCFICYWYEANVAGSCGQRQHVLHDCTHITVPNNNLEKKENCFKSDNEVVSTFFSMYYRSKYIAANLS